MVAVQKPPIVDPGKVLAEASSIVQFSVTYGAQTKGTDDFMSPVGQNVVLFSKQGQLFVPNQGLFDQFLPNIHYL